MLNNKKGWKELERVVAHIENRLKPKGAIVRYGRKIRDPQGNRREVDATIELKVGSSNILIAVECRKWKAKQNIKWIHGAWSEENQG